MATKIICDKCETEIIGYTSEYNHIDFKKFLFTEGRRIFSKDLCDGCMDELVEFLEKPISEVLVKQIVQAKYNKE